MTEFEEDYYAILGIEDDATPEEIRKAYLKLAKKLHPDKFPNDDKGKAAAQNEFRQVTQGHYVLGDPERKAEYDRLRQIAKVRQAIRTGEAGPDGAGGETGGETSTATPDNINQKWAEKHLIRADELYRRRKFQEAETAIKEAIRLVPHEGKYHNKLAEIYLARNWRTYALTEVQTSLRIDPKDPEAKNLETRIKAMAREGTATAAKAAGAKKGFLDQLKDLLTKKV